MTEKKPFHRLPKAVVPENYAIKLHPDLVAFIFTGHEDITVVVRSTFGDEKTENAFGAHSYWFVGERSSQRGDTQLRGYKNTKRKILLFKW